LYDGIADLQKCLLRSKSIEDDDEPKRFKQHRTVVPISKTALANYENPITLRSNEKSEK
jgi:hypothetical protein